MLTYMRAILRQITALRPGRRAEGHISAGNMLYDAAGLQIGNIDLIQRSPTHLRVAGWVSAVQVTLRLGQGQVSASPTLLRPDVAAAFGTSAAAGFDLTMPRDAGPTQLILALSDGQQIIQPLPGPQPCG
jgi:hypothetical protein